MLESGRGNDSLGPNFIPRGKGDTLSESKKVADEKVAETLEEVTFDEETDPESVVSDVSVEPVGIESDPDAPTEPYPAPVVEMVPREMLTLVEAELAEQVALNNTLTLQSGILAGTVEAMREAAAKAPAGAPLEPSDSPSVQYRGDYIPEGHPAYDHVAKSSGKPLDYVPAAPTFQCPDCDHAPFKTQRALDGHSATHKSK